MQALWSFEGHKITHGDLTSDKKKAVGTEKNTNIHVWHGSCPDTDVKLEF